VVRCQCQEWKPFFLWSLLLWLDFCSLHSACSSAKSLILRCRCLPGVGLMFSRSRTGPGCHGGAWRGVLITDSRFHDADPRLSEGCQGGCVNPKPSKKRCWEIQASMTAGKEPLLFEQRDLLWLWTCDPEEKSTISQLQHNIPATTVVYLYPKTRNASVRRNDGQENPAPGSRNCKLSWQERGGFRRRGSRWWAERAAFAVWGWRVD